MERLAIIDHDEHLLYIEDVSQEDLDNCGGEEEEYIKQNYPLLKNFSWDYIRGACYLQKEDKNSEFFTPMYL